MDGPQALDALKVTEEAAISASRLAGKGDPTAIDQAGTDAMRRVLATLNIDGRVVIGEGERDEAPMLYIGERVGLGGEGSLPVDIAVDPVEGTTVTAKGLPNAVAVIAMAERDGLLHAPDIYMEKLIVGPPSAGRVDLNWPVAANLKGIATALDRSVDELVVVVLDRPRHEQLIAEVRAAGARIRLIGDGDVIAAIAAAVRGTGVHAVMGTGGAPEGVLAAAALKCLGGEIQGRFVVRNDDERGRLERAGVSSDRVYKTDDLAPGRRLVFAATGITGGDVLNPVRFFSGGARTHSVTMSYSERLVRFLETVHLWDQGARVHVQFR